jgi:hypothetical protein
MALRNLQQYGYQTGNKLKEKSRDLNRNSSRFRSAIVVHIHTSTINAPELRERIILCIMLLLICIVLLELCLN